jgi:hypothetical protein
MYFMRRVIVVLIERSSLRFCRPASKQTKRRDRSSACIANLPEKPRWHSPKRPYREQVASVVSLAATISVG